MRNYQYSKLVEKLTPKSPLKKDLINAFLFGGAISCLGQVLRTVYLMTSMTLTEAKALVSITLIVITAILTILGVFDKIAKVGGAGCFVPTTVPKTLLAFFLICGIIILTQNERGVNMLDILKGLGVNVNDVNAVAEKLIEILPQNIVKKLIETPVLFYGLFNISDLTQISNVTNYNSTLNANVSEKFVESFKNAFYLKCYEKNMLSVDEYNKLINKEN